MNKAKDILNLTKAPIKRTKMEVSDEVQGGKLPYSPELVHGYEPNFMDGYKMKSGSDYLSVNDVIKPVKRNRNVFLVGPPGTGKSTLACHMIDMLNKDILDENRKIHGRNLPLIAAGVPANKLELYHDLRYKRILYNGHIGTRTEHMVGTIDVQYDEKGNRHAVRVPGFLSYSFITPGCKLVWDEMDLTLPEVLGEAHAYLDGRSNMLDVFLNGRWQLHKQKDFSIIATANTLGNGENQAEYAGTNPLNKAFLNRLNYVVHLEYLPHDDEVKLLTNATKLRKDIVESMVVSANETREAKKSGSVEYAMSTRDLFSWAWACIDDDNHQSTTSKNDYWNNIALKYVYPTFLNRIDDEAIREAYHTFLELRS